jgi:hypothetical protein
MTRWAYWFHLAALAATAAAYWPMRKANAGAMGEFHRQGSAELVTAWMTAHEEALPALRELLRADMRFLFCYPWLFVSMAALTGRTRFAAVVALAAVAAGVADYIETSKGLSILSGGNVDQAALMAAASRWKWRVFGFAAILTAFALYPSSGLVGHREIAVAIALCFLAVCYLTSGTQPAIAGLSFFAAAVTLAVAR